ncbi:MAG: hypothetical protein J6U54_09790 [Clostridiales bacterium]|nr:hypothetical protein [Clostridiales bacterium]
MVQIKTITTGASEEEVIFDKFNFMRGAKDTIYIWVRNFGDSDIYMSDHPGIVAGNDDVIKLGAKSVGLVTTAVDNKIYILGASTLECHAQFFAECPFRGVGSGGGGGGNSSYIGKTTTPLTDGSRTNPITINGQSVTAKKGDITVYNKQEFIFDGTEWNAFGDDSGLGDLAFKDSATGTFTPAGTVSAPTFNTTETPLRVTGTPEGSVSVSITPTTDTVTGITTVGTLPVFSYDSATENLSYTPGTLPTADTSKTVMTGASASATFTGSTLTSQGSVATLTEINAPTFTGTEGSVSVS